MKQSGFATVLLLIIILVVGVVGGAYYLGQKGIITKFTGPAMTSQSPAPVVEEPPLLPPIPETDETANWKTYKNEALSVSFKYPEGAIIQKRDSSDNSPNAIQVSYDDPKAIGWGGPRPGWFIIIDMFENPNKLTIEEWAKENNYTKGGYKGESPTPIVTSVAIGGKAGIKWVDSIKRDYNLIKNGNEIILIFTNVTSVAGKPEFNEAQYQSLVEEILSTFQFLP